MREIDDPLLQVPPARRGNRTPARFPSRKRGEPTEGGNQELWLRDWYNKKEGKHNLPPSLSWLDAQCLTDRRPLQALQASHPRRCRSFHRRLRRPFQA
jgi:hypothetical protein